MHTPSLLLIALTLLACTQQSPREMAAPATAVVYETPAVPSAAPFLETFETGSKGAYAPADEALATGTWRFEDALIGTSDQDHKTGGHAARLRGPGRLTMQFNAPAGVRTIRLQAAAYGQDGPSTWELWLSRDNGRSWQRNGQPIVTKGPKLVVSTFAGTATEPIRLQIRKTSNNDNRLNIDDISLETGAAVAATTPPAPTDPTPTTKNQISGTQPPNSRSDNDNLLLGNPSGATATPVSTTNYLLTRPQFATGYNAQRGTPTWTCWHLGRADITGAAPRQDDFRPDPALPRAFYSVTPKSYASSGFDKGHNCPSADRSATLDDNSATFLMSNMVPQAPHNNQQTWNHLEAYTRDQIEAGQEAYVLMGCYGRGGTGSKGLTQTLDQGRVTVPARIWKVIVLLPEGPNDLQRLAAGQGKVVAIDTPNDNAIDPDWKHYQTSVDKIEAATGLDLLSALPAAAQARLQK